MQTNDMIELMRQMQISGIKVLEYQADKYRLRLEKAETHDTENKEQTMPPAETDQDHIIKSPVVGVFYAAPAPGSEPFVKEGSRLEAGDTVCIIEAMKLMNEVTCGISGEVRQIFVKDGQRVEYGQPLISIKGVSDDTETD